MNETAELCESLEYVLNELDQDIVEQQVAVDEWIGRLDFYEGEGWDSEADLCRNILKQNMDRLSFLKETRSRVGRAISILTEN